MIVSLLCCCRSARSELSRLSTVIVSPRLASLQVTIVVYWPRECTRMLTADCETLCVLCRTTCGRRCSCTSSGTASMCKFTAGGRRRQWVCFCNGPTQPACTDVVFCFTPTACTECTCRGARRRYRLLDHPLPADNPAAAVLEAISTTENDPEIRADAFGNSMLAPTVGEQRWAMLPDSQLSVML